MKTFSFKIAFIDSYKFLINNIVLFLKTSFIAILLFSFVEYVFINYFNYDYFSEYGKITEVSGLIYNITLEIIITTMFVVVWGQYYLRKIPTVQIIDVLNWNEIKTKFAVASIKINVSFLISFSIINILFNTFINTNPYLSITLYVVLFITLYVVLFITLLIALTRVMFIFPHIIDGFSGNISNAINITKGNSIKLLFSYIGVILPVLIISLLFVLGTDYNSYSYFEALIMTVFVFISQAIITVYYINVYKQLAQ